MLRTATISTTIGPFTVVVGSPFGEDAVLASGWTDDAAVLMALVHPSLHDGSPPTAASDLGPFTDAARAYHDGDLTAIDAVPVVQRSGPFLEKAWSVLRTVPAGAPLTYAAYAAACGNAAAVRAAASACARNAAALFVPCHRIVRTGGGLGGFRWGLDAKRWLLAHESPAGGLFPTGPVPPR